MVFACAGIAWTLYARFFRPPGPIQSDYIFYHDREHGHRLKPNLRDARGVFPARPHPLPFMPDRPEYSNRITKRGEYLCSTNSEGLRGTREFKWHPAPGTVRIGALGDSITFGYGVADDESYPAVLEARLGTGFEVINAGVHGYNTTRALRALKDRLLLYHPHIVVICLGINDTVSVPEHSVPGQLKLWLSEPQYAEMEQRFVSNLDEMLVACDAAGAHVVLMVPPVNSFFPFPDVSRICVRMRQFAKERQVPLVDLERIFRDREEQDGLVLVTRGETQTLVQYSGGEPTELLSVQLEPRRFQFVADEVYDHIDSHPVDMALAYDGSHPNAEGMRLIAEQLEPVIREIVRDDPDLSP